MNKKLEFLLGKIIPFILIIIMTLLTVLDNTITNNIGKTGSQIIGFAVILILILYITVICVYSKKWREAAFEISLYAILFMVCLIFGVLFFISFVGDLTVIVNDKYNLGSGNWLSYFGAVIGSGVTVIGAYLVTRIQSNSDNKKATEAKAILLLNDLKYINSRVDGYIKLINQNVEKKDFYKIRYLSISENWRELVSFLFQNKVLDNDEVSTLYDFFTDTYYITEKYNELQELNINQLNSDQQNKVNFERKKESIKQNINKMYKTMAKHKVLSIIEKLNK